MALEHFRALKSYEKKRKPLYWRGAVLYHAFSSVPQHTVSEFVLTDETFVFLLSFSSPGTEK